MKRRVHVPLSLGRQRFLLVSQPDELLEGPAGLKKILLAGPCGASFAYTAVGGMLHVALQHLVAPLHLEENTGEKSFKKKRKKRGVLGLPLH